MIPAYNEAGFFSANSRDFCDIALWVSLRSRGRMSIHQQIAEACSHNVIADFVIEPMHVNFEFNALPDSY